MAGSSSNPDIFDVRKIRRLVELMKEHDLNEIDLRQENMRIQLRRGMGGTVMGGTVMGGTGPMPVGPSMPMAPVPHPAAAAAEQASAAQAEDNYAVISSPMVGTFYAASDPEAAPHVKVGDHIGPETTVCIVEAMKVFNEIPAEMSGKIVAVLVNNGEPVEFGQPLFKVDAQG